MHFFLGALRVNTHSASFNGLHVQMSKSNCMMISFTAEIMNLNKTRQNDMAACDIIANARVFSAYICSITYAIA